MEIVRYFGRAMRRAQGHVGRPKRRMRSGRCMEEIYVAVEHCISQWQCTARAPLRLPPRHDAPTFAKCHLPSLICPVLAAHPFPAPIAGSIVPLLFLRTPHSVLNSSRTPRATRTGLFRPSPSFNFRFTVPRLIRVFYLISISVCIVAPAIHRARIYSNFSA